MADWRCPFLLFHPRTVPQTACPFAVAMTCKPLFDQTNIANGSNRRLIQHNLSSHFPDKRRFLALMTRSWRPTAQMSRDTSCRSSGGRPNFSTCFEPAVRASSAARRQELRSEAEERIERERFESPDASNLSEAAIELLRRRLAGDHEVTDANRPLYCELVAARIMYPVSTWVGGPESLFRFTRAGWERRQEWINALRRRSPSLIFRAGTRALDELTSRPRGNDDFGPFASVGVLGLLPAQLLCRSTAPEGQRSSSG